MAINYKRLVTSIDMVHEFNKKCKNRISKL